jgi:UDP-glucuronate 4-epimerase
VKILVTGGAGFIGSHLCERLLHEGHQISIVDELNDFYSPALKHDNLNSVRTAGPVAFYALDICDRQSITAVLAKHRPDAIVHLAARAGVRPSLEQPLLYERVNVGGTLVLLEACRELGIPRFIFASSSSVYGADTEAPFSEEAAVSHPVSPYAATKLAGEQLCYAYSRLYGITVVCLRFFTVYGPRQRPDLAIWKFTDLIARGKPIPVFGDGSSGRDYTFVHDTVDGIVNALRYECHYDILNLGNSKPVSLLMLVHTIEEVIGRQAEIEWLPDQAGDVPITYADVSKAGRLLGYYPKTPFVAGVRKFVDWYLGREAAAGGA